MFGLLIQTINTLSNGLTYTQVGPMLLEIFLLDHTVYMFAKSTSYTTHTHTHTHTQRVKVSDTDLYPVWNLTQVVGCVHIGFNVL